MKALFSISADGGIITRLSEDGQAFLFKSPILNLCRQEKSIPKVTSTVDKEVAVGLRKEKAVGFSLGKNNKGGKKMPDLRHLNKVIDFERIISIRGDLVDCLDD